MNTIAYDLVEKKIYKIGKAVYRTLGEAWDPEQAPLRGVFHLN
jgi:hypothetical protein